MLDDYGASSKEISESIVKASAELVAEMNKDDGGCRHDGGYSTPCEEQEIYNNFASEGGIYNHESVMKEGRRRKRYKSMSL
ncbi:hypothetical protein LR48_Vigan04g148900 [Vigna angularis]|uniref:Uncharacterized protein n=1 Tax=Phaseolus angularis TaxID=3914 RepID=A0A0L9UEY1_PHAAN|nr:hypothetical protein LR48_Vigan04g148900 [Vigna angularis]